VLEHLGFTRGKAESNFESLAEVKKMEAAKSSTSKENTMRKYRPFDSVATALLAAAYLMIPVALQAADTPDSARITKLLEETKAAAVQLKTDSSDMVSFTRSQLSWVSYGDKIEQIKGHINNAGQLLAKLKNAESTGSPRQQMTIKRIEPLLQEMDDNLTATINYLNANPNKTHLPEFIGYVKTNSALATDMEAIVRASIDYGNDKAQLTRISSK
jgi:hypothetical protein